MGEAREKAN